MRYKIAKFAWKVNGEMVQIGYVYTCIDKFGVMPYLLFESSRKHIININIIINIIININININIKQKRNLLCLNF